MEKSSNRKLKFFGGIFFTVVVLDFITKRLALQFLPERVPQPILDDWFRLTLVFNRGAAFGLHLGHDAFTRIVFIVLTGLALVILWRLLRDARVDDTPRIIAVSLVCAGAVGNLIDRLRWSRGVVDFVDIGVAGARWPTFNVADMAVTTGAITLAFVLWREDSKVRKESTSLAPAGTSPAHTAPHGQSLSESGGETAV